MTFSLVARCAETGMFGVAVSSSSPAVAARCAYARAGAGAVASQNVTDPTLGPKALDLLASGLSAADTKTALSKVMTHPDFRQVLIVDKNGTTAIHSGAKSLGTWTEATGTDVAAAGNLLATPGVPAAMVRAFENSAGKSLHLGDRLLDAMQAGLGAGGEAGPIHSAGIKLVDNVAWPVAISALTGRKAARLANSRHYGRCISRSSKTTSPAPSTPRRHLATASPATTHDR